MTIQITIIRIEGYGPWTLTLGSDREGALQMLQARIYYDVQRLFSERESLVFPNRFDEYFAISNGLSVQDHILIQKELKKLYKNLNLSMAIGNGITPFEANINAYDARRREKILDKRTRIFGEASCLAFSCLNPSSIYDFAQIMHVDIDGSTDVSCKLSPYEITSLVSKIHANLSQEFLKKGSMTFFIGGDNFMVISNETKKQDAQKIIETVTKGIDIKLNCGIGIGRTGRKAAEAATRALDTIRTLRNEGKIQPFYEIQCL
ncbi:MAG TPA: GTP cyclohydrolase IIa [Nitrososphaeraceae archaeon]|nr:GTP cyclohydrolase IIa [Nitrososphaeraceae archaeon]